MRKRGRERAYKSVHGAAKFIQGDEAHGAVDARGRDRERQRERERKEERGKVLSPRCRPQHSTSKIEVTIRASLVKIRVYEVKFFAYEIYHFLRGRDPCLQGRILSPKI